MDIVCCELLAGCNPTLVRTSPADVDREPEISRWLWPSVARVSCICAAASAGCSSKNAPAQVAPALTALRECEPLADHRICVNSQLESAAASWPSALTSKPRICSACVTHLAAIRTQPPSGFEPLLLDSESRVMTTTLRRLKWMRLAWKIASMKRCFEQGLGFRRETRQYALSPFGVRIHHYMFNINYWCRSLHSGTFFVTNHTFWHLHCH